MKETLYYVVRIAAFIVIAIAAHTALHAKGCAEEIVTVYSWGNYELRWDGRNYTQHRVAPVTVPVTSSRAMVYTWELETGRVTFTRIQRHSGRYMMYQPLEALEKRRFHGFTQR